MKKTTSPRNGWAKNLRKGAGLGLGVLTLTLTLSFGPATTLRAEPDAAYYGETPVKMDKRTMAPANATADVFGSELFIDGRTDVALDARSQAAQALVDQNMARQRQRELDRSIRADIASGQPVTVLIAPEHFVQLTFLRNNEIVYPRRAFAGQPNLLIIDKKDNSPYVYLAAAHLLEGQTTNLFVETEEDGRIQTYVINLLVTEPRNIREQVSVNLVEDRTPPIRGGEGSEKDWQNKTGFGVVGNAGAGATGSGTPGSGPSGGTSTGAGGTGTPGLTGVVSGKFSEDDVRKYLNTMIEMAGHFPEAKQVEGKTGRIIYRDTDIRMLPGGRMTYVDPVEGTLWNVKQVWFFPKYDAILLDVRVKNPNQKVSFWDFSQVRWQANESPKSFPSTAAAPVAMQTLPSRSNQIWYLVQGNRLDPQAEFSPVFPRAERRGTGTKPNSGTK
jgi:hypothetical protein